MLSKQELEKLILEHGNAQTIYEWYINNGIFVKWGINNER